MAHCRHRLSFVAVMFSRRAAEYCARFDLFGFWAVLPTVFTVFVVTIRRRNRLMKRQEQAEFETARQKAVQADEKQDGKV